jgi:hypothetical protein
VSEIDDTNVPAAPPQEEQRRRRHRKLRSFWKRKRFWIAVFATVLAIGLVLWLISTLGVRPSEVD